ncbi:MAG: hypothetical protein GY870_16525 [archaeon]|nr:hypothetical protein [archaeon]
MIIDIYEDKEKRCYNEANGFHNSYGPDETHSNGFKTYYINGEAHNQHGPASICSNDDVEYCLNNMECTKEEWERLRHDY